MACRRCITQADHREKSCLWYPAMLPGDTASRKEIITPHPTAQNIEKEVENLAMTCYQDTKIRGWEGHRDRDESEDSGWEGGEELRCV